MDRHHPLVVVSALFLLSYLLAVPVDGGNVVPAIFVFGDSTADVGNNNHLEVGEATRANYPHNGIDFPGGKITGRFCNGYVQVDFLAQKMGFEESPPAYFSLGNDSRPTTGVNFASGGSGVLDQTGMNVSFSMSTQIEFFDTIVKKLTIVNGKKETKYMLSRSIFIFSTINNDIFAYIEHLNSTSTTDSKDQAFASIIVQQLSNQLKKVYELGARKFVVFGTAKLGCVPSKRARIPSGRCLETMNNVSFLVHEALRKEMQSLCSRSPGMKYSYVNNFNISKAISSDPSSYGFKEVNNACCGGGRFHAETLCLPDVQFCSNREEYGSWDYVHPTQAMYKLLSSFTYNGNSTYVEPLNVKDLAMA